MKQTSKSLTLLAAKLSQATEAAMSHILKFLALLALTIMARVQQMRGCIALANTYDAAVETHEGSVRRTNDAAITARHLLWKQGSGDNTVALCGATDLALGTIDNVEASTGLGQTVYLLGKGCTKKMVASEAIDAGERVFQAASGKVQDLPVGAGTYKCVGTALTKATADGHIIEVADCQPFDIVVAS